MSGKIEEAADDYEQDQQQWILDEEEIRQGEEESQKDLKNLASKLADRRYFVNADISDGRYWDLSSFINVNPTGQVVRSDFEGFTSGLLLKEYVGNILVRSYGTSLEAIEQEATGIYHDGHWKAVIDLVVHLLYENMDQADVVLPGLNALRAKRLSEIIVAGDLETDEAKELQRLDYRTRELRRLVTNSLIAVVADAEITDTEVKGMLEMASYLLSGVRYYLKTTQPT